MSGAGSDSRLAPNLEPLVWHAQRRGIFAAANAWPDAKAWASSEGYFPVPGIEIVE